MINSTGEISKKLQEAEQIIKECMEATEISSNEYRVLFDIQIRICGLIRRVSI